MLVKNSALTRPDGITSVVITLKATTVLIYTPIPTFHAHTQAHTYKHTRASTQTRRRAHARARACTHTITLCTRTPHKRHVEWLFCFFFVFVFFLRKEKKSGVVQRDESLKWKCFVAYKCYWQWWHFVKNDLNVELQFTILPLRPTTHPLIPQ